MSKTNFTDLKKGFKIDLLFEYNPLNKVDYDGYLLKLEKIQSNKSKELRSDYIPFIHEGIKIAIQLICKYLDIQVIKEYFPGLLVESINSYDLSKSNIRIYVFSWEDMNIFYKQFNQPPTTSAITLPLRDIKSKIFVGMPILIIRQRTLKKDSSSSLHEKRLMIQKDVVQVAIHETLHILGLSMFHLPSTNLLLEPLVEILAIKGVNSVSRFVENSEVKKHQNVGYSNMTYGLYLLINKLKENGLSFDDFICGYGFGDKDTLNKINKKIIELFGEQAYLELQQIINNNPSNFNSFIKNLL